MGRTQTSGKAGEDRAADFLRAQGFQILRRNYRSRFGEIDLIAARRDLLLFVEVKARSSNRFGTGAASVNHHKQQKLIQTARWYLAHHGGGRQRIRFDVIEIDPGDQADPVWIDGAFEVPA